jgi:TPR repeat protein
VRSSTGPQLSQIAQNRSQSERYYRISADQGNAYAQVHYGCALATGKGVAQNLSEAAKYYKMSADQGNERGTRLYALALQKLSEPGL